MLEGAAGVKTPRSARVTTVTRREYSEPVESHEHDEETPEDVGTGWEESDETQDALDEFLSENQDYIIRVERITDAYVNSGRTSLRTTQGVWCDDIPLTKDFRQVIKNTFGSGVYRLILKGNTDEGVRIKRHMILKIAAPLQLASIHPGGTGQPGIAPINIYQPTGQTIDPMQLLKEQLKASAELMKLMREFMPQPAQVQTVEGNTAAAELSGRLQVIEKIIDLSGKNESLAEKLLGKVLGGDEEKSSGGFMDFVTALIQNGPAILQGLSQWAITNAAAASQPVAPAQLPAATTIQSQPATPAGPETAPQAYNRVIRHLVENMRANASTYSSVDELSHLAETYPELAQNIGQLMQAPPSQLIGLLSQMRGYEYVTQIAHAEKWIEDLQAEFKKEWADDEQQTADDNRAANQ